MAIDFRPVQQFFDHADPPASAPDDRAPSPMIGEVFHSWHALEHEHLDVTPRAYMVAGTLLILVILYAIFTDSPLMAIVFILVGAVGYLSTQKEPRMLEFLITSKGMIAGNELFSYKGMDSFWIFDDTDFQPFVSFHTPGKMATHLHIPLGDTDPQLVRDILSQFLSEHEHELGIVDTLGKMFHI
jgi:hypothetical protein